MAAISRPLGAHTGPKFSRMPTDWCGTGSNQRSGAKVPLPAAVVSGSTATHSTWLVPSRNRDEYGPQSRHDHGAAVGRPARAPRLEDPVVRLPLLARRDLDDAQLRLGVEERQAGAIGRPRRGGARRWRPGDRGRCADRESTAPTAPSRSDRERQLVAVGRPHRVGLHERVAGQALGRGLAFAGRDQPQIAEGAEGDSGAVGRDCRMHQPTHRLRPVVGEAPPLGVNGARVKATSAENASVRAAPPAIGPALHHAVGGVEHFGGRRRTAAGTGTRPRSPRRCSCRRRRAGDGAVDGRVGHRGAIGRPGHRGHRASASAASRRSAPPATGWA